MMPKCGLPCTEISGTSIIIDDIYRASFYKSYTLLSILNDITFNYFPILLLIIQCKFTLAIR